jgi:hypothetical protein
MATECHTQLGFGFQGKIVLDFNGCLFQERGQQVDWDRDYYRRVLLRGHLHKTLKETELQGHGLFPHDLGRIRQLLRGLKFS